MSENEVIAFLEGLTPADLSRILTRIPSAANYVPQGVSPLERVSGLLGYVRSSAGPGFGHLEAVIRELFPDNFPPPNQRNQIVVTLTELTELVDRHLQAIHSVTAPILKNRDILTTCRNYDELVNNADFPRGYSKIRGVLEAVRGPRRDLPNIGTIQDKLATVLDELSSFQYAAFMVAYDSYRMADTMRAVADYWSRLPPASNEEDLEKPGPELLTLQSRLKESFQSSFHFLLSEDKHGSPQSVEGMDTREGVMSVVGAWCRAWERTVQRKLYGGRGLDYAIAQVKSEIVSPAATILPSSPDVTVAELRQLMTERLSRSEVGILWFDLFGSTMDEEVPGRPKPECVIELLSRAKQRNKMGLLTEAISRLYPHALEDRADPR